MSGTIDERIDKLLKKKNLIFQNVVDGLSEQQIDDLISEQEWFEILGVKRVEPEQPEVEQTARQSMSLTEIRDQLFNITPKAFEELVQQLMHYWGYSNVKVIGQTGDGGIDVISTRNTGQGTERVAAQCKRYRNVVGVNLARDFSGALKDKQISKGYLITTSEFSDDCLAFCDRNDIETLSGLEIAIHVQRFGLNVNNKG